MTPSVGVLNIWRDIKPPDCSLWPFKFLAINFNPLSTGFCALLGLSSIPFLSPVLPLDVFRLCESRVSGTHCTQWDHTFLWASHPAVPIEKWRTRGRLQIPRPSRRGGRQHSRGSTHRHGAAILPRTGALVLYLHPKFLQDGSPQPPTHAAVGITHVPWGGCAGKARTCHDSGETQTWVSLQ